MDPGRIPRGPGLDGAPCAARVAADVQQGRRRTPAPQPQRPPKLMLVAPHSPRPTAGTLPHCNVCVCVFGLFAGITHGSVLRGRRSGGHGRMRADVCTPRLAQPLDLLGAAFPAPALDGLSFAGSRCLTFPLPLARNEEPVGPEPPGRLGRDLSGFPRALSTGGVRRSWTPAPLDLPDPILGLGAGSWAWGLELPRLRCPFTASRVGYSPGREGGGTARDPESPGRGG